MADINDVAAYIVRHFEGPISTMKLQKLAYFAQGWHLGITSKRLFEGEFEAWAKGPVNKALYAQHRRQFSVHEWPSGDPTQVAGFERKVVDAVLSNYGALSGIQLSEISHLPGAPWDVTRRQSGVPEGARSQVAVDTQEMHRYFALHLGIESRPLAPGQP